MPSFFGFRDDEMFVFEPFVCHRMVVSTVIGNAFRNSCARSGSSMRDVTSSMIFSTAEEVKERHSCVGRWKGSFKGPSLYGGLEAKEPS